MTSSLRGNIFNKNKLNVDIVSSQCEGNESSKWHGPPIHFRCHSKGQNATKECQRLLMMDSGYYQIWSRIHQVKVVSYKCATGIGTSRITSILP
jgi:hypothetical protein